MTKKEIKDKLDSLSDEEIHSIICKALVSANVPYTINNKDGIKFEPLKPEDYIDKIQSGDVQPVVHSNWQETYGIWFCPECDEEYPQWYGEPSWRFCPMCGARMDLKEQNG